MRPIAIISTDSNPDYLSLVPIVCKSWDLQGFDVYLSVCNPVYGKQYDAVINALPSNVGLREDKGEIKSVNSALYTQCIRLYMPFDVADKERYCILSDADMMIGSSFLYRDFDKVNSFGHDLTGFGETPCCYVGMTATKWIEVMGSGGMQSDLSKCATPNSDDWYKAWGCDQQILTAKLKEYGFDKINFINRGHDQKNDGLPIGRWDRHNLKKPSGEIHDIHLMRSPFHDAHFPKLMEICETVYPNENWGWVHQYKREFTA